MPILSAIVASDSDVILVKYSLANESFSSFQVFSYPFNPNNNQEVITPLGTSHGTATTSGSFTVSLTKSKLSSLGITWDGLINIQLRTSQSYSGYGDNASATTNKSHATVLLGKTVDCCIADKMYNAIGCDCNDDKCNEELRDAQKMFLLKRSAEYVLSSLRDVEGPDSSILAAASTDANNKYQKALQLCSSGCGCDGSSSMSTGSSSSTSSY